MKQSKAWSDAKDNITVRAMECALVARDFLSFGAITMQLP